MSDRLRLKVAVAVDGLWPLRGSLRFVLADGRTPRLGIHKCNDIIDDVRLTQPRFIYYLSLSYGATFNSIPRMLSLI